MGLTTHDTGLTTHGMGLTIHDMGLTTHGMGLTTHGMGLTTHGMGQTLRLLAFESDPDNVIGPCDWGLIQWLEAIESDPNKVTGAMRLESVTTVAPIISANFMGQP